MPALEFSKMICNHVLGLDPAFNHEASILLRNLLNLLQIREFAQEVVTGREPSLTLVVPDVICQECQ